MATIIAGRTGVVNGSTTSDFATARTTPFSSTANPSTSNTSAIKYIAAVGRGSVSHTMNRTFAYFNTTSIGYAVENVSLNIVGALNVGNGLRVVKSTAFGGDGSSDIVDADFTTFDTGTPYNDASYTWLTGTNNITLNSSAASDIQNNNAFIVCLMQANNDFSNTGAVTNLTEYFGIDFSTSITLTFDAAPAVENNSLTISSGKLMINTGRFTI
jgi:hypothetical protein